MRSSNRLEEGGSGTSQGGGGWEWDESGEVGGGSGTSQGRWDESEEVGGGE